MRLHPELDLDQAPPTVLFADVGHWDAFLELAAALRRNGLTVQRVTVPTATVQARVRDRLQLLIYSEVDHGLRWNSADDSIYVDSFVLRMGKNIVGIEAVDSVGAALANSHHFAELSRHHKSGPHFPESLLYDKLAMTRHVQSLGHAVPETWDPDEDQVGKPPLVVKHRLGSGGEKVRLVSDLEELDAVRSALSNQRDQVFVQRFEAGELVHVAGVAHRGKVLQGAVYTSTAAEEDPLGPSAEILILDEPPILTIASTLVESIGYSGAFCIDYIKSNSGQICFIDFNGRIFGSWSGLQRAGSDILGAYLYISGMTTVIPKGVAIPGGRFVIRLAPLLCDGRRSRSNRLREALRILIADTKLLGVRWLILAIVEILWTFKGMVQRNVTRVP